MPKILIIGAGKVGTATNIAIGNIADYHDPYKGIINSKFNDYEYVLVCVDTVQTGPNDYRDLESVFGELSTSSYSGLVVVRSTVSPEKLTELDSKFSLNFVLFPEFMPQRDGELIVDSTWIALIGGDRAVSEKFANEVLIANSYPANPDAYKFVTKEEASIIKLADNAGLSAKLIYFNAIYKICERFGASYEEVRSAIGMDSRIGIEHSIVPSPDDDKFGFGGHCLPKDIKAIAEIDSTGFFKKIEDINIFLRNS